MDKNNDHKNIISRRGFLKIAGLASAASAAAFYGCTPKKSGLYDRPTAGTRESGGEMTYRTSAKGDKVSLLGYGCMRWPTIPSPDGKGDIIDQETVNGLIDYAIAHGVNYFDTSPVYVQGMSEKATGIALKRHPRNSFLVATKMSNFSNSDYHFGVEMYRNSMKNLQVDYLDYYLLHMLGAAGERGLQGRFIDNGLLNFLLKEREAGRIRHLGWSFHGLKEEFDRALAMHDDVHWDFVQIQLNYVDWRHASGMNVNAEYLYEELDKRGIQAIVMEPLLGGRLSKVPEYIAARLKQRRPEDSVASWAFRYAGSPAKVLTVLSGMTYMEHLQDNLRTFSPLVPLEKSDYDFLEETARMLIEYPTVPCNDCKYCMPCPYGIDIPAILLYYNKCINEGTIPENSRSESYSKARKAYLIGYDRAVPKLRQADHCIGCEQCNPHCPQSINIPQELHRIDRFVEQLKQNNRL